MKERPILFNEAMVRAIIQGRKTQTRRMVGGKSGNTNVTPTDFDETSGLFEFERYTPFLGYRKYWIHSPFGQVGDRLWVRETWKPGAWREDAKIAIDYAASPEITNTPWILLLEHADYFAVKNFFEKINLEIEQSGLKPDLNNFYHWEPGKSPLKWRPSIHMPRWASRITLEITNVRVERLQDISEEDARAEGCEAIEGCKWHTWEEADAGIPMHEHTARDAFGGLWESINGADSWDKNPWVWVIEFKRVGG